MIIADENVDQTIIDYLRSNHHKVYSIREDSPGISDREVIKIAESKRAVVLTEDKDFGELVFSFQLQGCSVILLRYLSSPDEHFIEQIAGAVHHSESNPGHYFYTVTPKKVRFRKI